MKKQKIKCVLVVLHLSVSSGRDFLTGFSRYAKENFRWQIRILSDPSELSVLLINDAIASGLDGIVTAENKSAEVAAALERDNTPIVILGHDGQWISKRHQNITFIRNDDVDIGRFAAKHLLSLGRFRSYAFIPDHSDSYWAKERCRGFFEQLKGSPAACQAFEITKGESHVSRRSRLITWLNSLPKPLGVFSASDHYAGEILELCAANGIEVPQSLAVIGVDNDALICDFTNPPLTSIFPDHERMGVLAAQALNKMMRASHAPPAHHIFSKDKTIVERESTRTVVPAAHLVEETIRFIKANVTKKLSTEDVVKHLGISRRLADLRLRQLQGETVAGLVQRIKLEEVARWLRTSNVSCIKIAHACSYDNPKHLSNAFKRHFGISMIDYRKNNAAQQLLQKSARSKAPTLHQAVQKPELEEAKETHKRKKEPESKQSNLSPGSKERVYGKKHPLANPPQTDGKKGRDSSKNRKRHWLEQRQKPSRGAG